jgi:hypothetical protein
MRELHAIKTELLRIKWHLAALRFQRALQRHALALKAYNPEQPRDELGKWTSGGGSSLANKPTTTRQINDPRVISDATPDNLWRPGAQYAQNLPAGSSGGMAEIPAQIPSSADIDKNIEEATAHKLDYPWFYGQVRNNGPWDYKQEDRKYADFGNFNYGATGKAAGFSEETLLRSAGWAQVQAGTSRPEWGKPMTLMEALLGIGGEAPFGDDPRDQYWISQGFKYYDSRKR